VLSWCPVKPRFAHTIRFSFFRFVADMEQAFEHFNTVLGEEERVRDAINAEVRS
jgi:hypothetical protein